MYYVLLKRLVSITVSFGSMRTLEPTLKLHSLSIIPISLVYKIYTMLFQLSRFAVLPDSTVV